MLDNKNSFSETFGDNHSLKAILTEAIHALATLVSITMFTMFISMGSLVFASEYGYDDPMPEKSYDDDEYDSYYDDEYDQYDYWEDDFAYALNPERDYLILVNDENEYAFDGDYDQALQQDLVMLPDYNGEDTPIEKGAAEAFRELREYLINEEDIDIQLYSAYRTYEDQEWVYDYYSDLDGWSDTNYVAEPGFSEHHTGLLLNIVVWWPEIATWATETPERTAEDPEFFGTIHDTLADFGFIDRYPEGKEDITGYPAEPYEIRFVGSSETAHGIMDYDLCLEEYLDHG